MPNEKRYFVQTPLLHDGKRHEIGEEVVLSDELVPRLLELGTVKEADAGAEETKATEETKGKK